MSPFDPNKATLFEKVLWGERHGAFQTLRGQRLLRAVKLGIEDKVIEQLVDDAIRPLVKAAALGRLPPFRAARLNDGELLFGHDPYGNAVFRPVDSLNAGLLIASGSGGGKSNLLRHLLLQIAAAGRPFWVFEQYKTEHRSLLRLMERERR